MTKRHAKTTSKSRKRAMPAALQPVMSAEASSATAKRPKKMYQASGAEAVRNWSTILGIGLALCAFVGIIVAIVYATYQNRPSRVQSLAQAADYQKARETCGHQPFVVITTTNDYNETSYQYYAPGHAEYNAQVTELPRQAGQVKRFKCELDNTLITYATPYYSDAEQPAITDLYIQYARAKGLQLLAPTYLPDDYRLNRQTLSSTTYIAAYSATGNESLDGFFTSCSLLRDAPDRAAVAAYRTDAKLIQSVNAIKLYGDTTVAADGSNQPQAQFAEVGDMWCSFNQNGQRYLPNTAIAAVLASLAPQSDEVARSARPVANQ